MRICSTDIKRLPPAEQVAFKQSVDLEGVTLRQQPKEDTVEFVTVSKEKIGDSND